MNKNIEILEFDKIKNMLSEFVLTQHAKDKIENLKPSIIEREVISMLDNTTEARILLDSVGLYDFDTVYIILKTT